MHRRLCAENVIFNAHHSTLTPLCDLQLRLAGSTLRTARVISSMLEQRQRETRRPWCVCFTFSAVDLVSVRLVSAPRLLTDLLRSRSSLD